MADANAKYCKVNLIFALTPIGVQEKESIMSVSQSLVMPNCNPRDRFFDQYLTVMKDSYILGDTILIQEVNIFLII